MLALAAQKVANLPGEQGGRLTLELDDSLHDLRCGDLFRFGAADRAGPYGSSLVEASEYLADTAMAHEQLARYVAGSHSDQCQLNDTLANVQRERPSIDEDAAQLIYTCLTWTLVR